jgi:hypothetical protein
LFSRVSFGMSCKTYSLKNRGFPMRSLRNALQECRQLYDANLASDERKYRILLFLQTCCTHPPANVL